jgi:hypothetical protein
METERDDRGKQVKRRGILTAAGALVAGVMAKQLSEPVAASQSFLLPSTETVGLSYSVAGPTTIASTNSYVSTSPVLTLNATVGNTQAAVQGTFNAPIPAPSPAAIYGQGGAFLGVYGLSNVAAVRGDIPSVAIANTTAVNGTNQATLCGGVGVLGVATNGIGESFQGGTAPLRLVPGALASTAITAAGHQAGEIYVTSDHLLYFFDGAQWRQVKLGAGQQTNGTPTPTPTPAAPTPTVPPGLTPTPSRSPTPVPGTPNPIPAPRSSPAAGSPTPTVTPAAPTPTNAAPLSRP